jgi:PAS domain S-box-containing protein
MSELKRILIVEDEAIVAKDIELRLRAMGYDIIGLAASGEKALTLLESSSADLVLMDITLKGKMDGIETAGIVRNLYDIPVVFLTAYADTPTLERAKTTDPFGYILKPFEERSLQIHIEIAFHKYQNEKRIKAREKWIESVLNSISSAVIATDSDGHINYVNPAAEELLEIPRSDLLSTSVITSIRFFDESELPMMSNPIQLVLKKGTAQLYDQIGIQINANTPKMVQLSAVGLRDHKESVNGVVIGLRDISRRRRTERELHSTQQEIDDRVEAKVKLLRKKLDHSQIQLKLNHETIKQLRKIERRYGRLTQGEAVDE